MNILFAAPNCLLDASSGASMSCRRILEGLAARGHNVKAFSATVFDCPQFPNSQTFLQHIRASVVSRLPEQQSTIWGLKRNLVTYFILPSRALTRLKMTCEEEIFFQEVLKSITKQVRPDVVLAYGGWFMEKDTYRWLKGQNIPTAFYLANPRYNNADTFRDITLLLTDSEATAELYKNRLGLTLHPLGKFITPVKLAAQAPRDCVTFINPSMEKGATVFISIVQEAQRRGLSAQFLVVESKARLEGALKALGHSMSDFPNITCLPLQEDMTNVWSRTRVLLSPSLWHESGPRTIVEACSAGIPVLSTDSGGAPEFLGEFGFLFPIPPEAKEKASNPVNIETAKEWTDFLEKLLTDEVFFAQASERASERWRVLNQRDPFTKLEKLFEGALPKT